MVNLALLWVEKSADELEGCPRLRPSSSSTTLIYPAQACKGEVISSLLHAFVPAMQLLAHFLERFEVDHDLHSLLTGVYCYAQFLMQRVCLVTECRMIRQVSAVHIVYMPQWYQVPIVLSFAMQVTATWVVLVQKSYTNKNTDAGSKLVWSCLDLKKWMEKPLRETRLRLDLSCLPTITRLQDEYPCRWRNVDTIRICKKMKIDPVDDCTSYPIIVQIGDDKRGVILKAFSRLGTSPFPPCKQLTAAVDLTISLHIMHCHARTLQAFHH